MNSMIRCAQACTGISLLLMLAACATPQTRGIGANTESTSPPSTLIAPVAQDRPVALLPIEVHEEAPRAALTPWERLRARFAMPGCEYNSEVVRWAGQFTQNPKLFAESWKPAMPFLLFVLDEIERRNLPGEFALLPYVESSYQAIPPQGQRPAGIWQLMPRTAADLGLRISSEYDGRLDIVDSTRAALDLIERYDREFGDWRLATMAYNAGEYRLKRELGNRTASDLPAEELARLRLSATSHDHLHKMLALACIVDNPQRFNVRLPDAEESDQLSPQIIEQPIDLRLVANMTDLPLEELKSLNPAWLGHRMPDTAPLRVLIPSTHVNDFQSSRSAIDSSLLTNWKSYRVPEPSPLADIARIYSIAPDALAAANRLEPDALLSSGTELLVPGKGSAVPAPRPRADVHIIRKGDTLSSLAKTYKVSVVELLKWNRLRANSVLKLGARVHVREPS
jgi:membrane-bound lytic murein transglycosylase D